LRGIERGIHERLEFAIRISRRKRPMGRDARVKDRMPGRPADLEMVPAAEKLGVRGTLDAGRLLSHDGVGAHLLMMAVSNTTSLCCWGARSAPMRFL
jgi:hypothetical protein